MTRRTPPRRSVSVLPRPQHLLLLSTVLAGLVGWPASLGGGAGGVEEFVPLRALGFQASLVDYSPDGRWVAAGYWPGIVRLVDGETGELQERQLLTEARLTSLRWSPDGHYLAIGHDRANNPAEITIWDVEQGTRALTLEGHGLRVTGVSWRPDGQQLASVGYDAYTRIWDVTTGTLVRVVPGGTSAVAWSPDGREIATGSFSHLVRIVDAATGQLRLELRGHTAPVVSVAWSPDGRYLASGGSLFDGTVKVWKAEDGSLLRTLRHEGEVFQVAWRPDGALLTSVGGVIRIWEPIVTGALVRTLGENVESVAWHPGGRRIASGSGVGAVLRLWDADSGEESRRVFDGHGGEVDAVSWHPEGQVLASYGRPAVFGDPSTIKLWDVASGRSVATWVDACGLPWSLAWRPDGQLLASGNFCDTVRVWDPATGREVWTLPEAGRVVAWRPDGGRLATMRETRVQVWDVEGRTLVQTLAVEADQTLSWIAWSPDGQALAASRSVRGGSPLITIWDVASWEVVATARGLTPYWIRQIAWSPDSRAVAGIEGASCCISDLRVWDAATGELVRTLPTDRGLTSLAWRPVGPYIASGEFIYGSPICPIRLWDAETGTLMGTLFGHIGGIGSVSWSADGRALASASSDRTVRVWGARPNSTYTPTPPAGRAAKASHP